MTGPARGVMISVSSILILAGIVIASGLSGCGKDPKAEQEQGGASVFSSSKDRVLLAVTNTYLEAAVRDIMSERFLVVSLAGPGMCPGHFDLSPGQVEQLGRAGMLFRFDFQAGLDEGLSGVRSRGLKIQPIQAGEGMSCPSVYEKVCVQVCEALEAQYPEYSQHFNARLVTVRRRLAGLDKYAGNFSGITAVCSNRQDAFAKWLGLEVCEVFGPVDEAGPRDIERCIQSGVEHNVQVVIANAQQGTSLAQKLAERLGVGLAVFNNFPVIQEDGESFDRMVEANAAALVSGIAP